MKIKKGSYWKCLKNFMFEDGSISYFKGKLYQSENDNCLTNEQGDKRHEMPINYIGEYFVKIDFLIAPKSRELENINPKHYSFSIKGTPCDLFDIGNAMDLNKEQFTALRYFRKKENQIEDTKKAIKCLERLVERLESERNG